MLKRRAGCPRGTPALGKSLQKRKRPRLKRVMGRSSNSPPPKSAHKQPNGFRVRWEWLERATYKLVMSAVGRLGLPVEEVWCSRGNVLSQ